ncbi:zinc-dependent peptidase [Aliikangiella marina]|uniref:Zinc-dependent peptidase n=1 Tax=Aliikangiella marina TaxID=1712262 RepID=A0A545T2S0_9GAMM|nr:M90 family metallopeptidase [Aliikangiella marina]TQV71514.1 zinc-dependent peptidase [Aliikangiella marina]
MNPIIIIILVAAGLIGWIFIKPKLKELRRDKIRSQPFPKIWREILRQNVPYFYSMPSDLQLQLKQHILVFLSEKAFFGFEGVKINDEVRVTIAAQACLLLLNRKTDYYPKLKSIYVYPAAFITKHQSADSAGVLQNHHRVLSGESWDLGKVVLSWKDTHQGGLVFNDGHNVVIHEFAHQLDQETGAANGAPFVSYKKQKSWSQVLSKEFELLQKQAAKGEETLLDHYGATNPAEFFAVASEVFFERPAAMLRQHQALYRQLQSFYQVNPAIW